MNWIDRLFGLADVSGPFCPECDSQISDKATYCEHCGAWLAYSKWMPCGSFNWGLVLETLADLLTYPTAEYPAKVQASLATLSDIGEEPAWLLAGFADRVKTLSTEQLQKVYQDTFELTPSCFLEIGKQLYPSDKRKEADFVAWMRQKLSSKKVKTFLYAPDNLILCLRAGAGMNAACGEDLDSAVLPAVSRIVASMRGTNNPFEKLLMTVEWILTPR
jgi:nitrate reductase assembly molybdenum cofactor insertion protein NarJ